MRQALKWVSNPPYVSNFISPLKISAQKDWTFLQRECVKVPMPAHRVLPLMGHIFESSYSMSAIPANKIWSTDQSELLNLWAGIGTLTYRRQEFVSLSQFSKRFYLDLVWKTHHVLFSSTILYILFFYKQLVYKQLTLGGQIAKQLPGLTLLSLSNNKNYMLKKWSFSFTINVK